jgi:hypothetical protein
MVRILGGANTVRMGEGRVEEGRRCTAVSREILNVYLAA